MRIQRVRFVVEGGDADLISGDLDLAAAEVQGDGPGEGVEERRRGGHHNVAADRTLEEITNSQRIEESGF